MYCFLRLTLNCFGWNNKINWNTASQGVWLCVGVCLRTQKSHAGWKNSQSCLGASEHCLLLKKVPENLNEGPAAIPTPNVCAIETASKEPHPDGALWTVQHFSSWKTEPCSHPKWGFGGKPQTLNPLHNLWCVSVPGSLYWHCLSPKISLQQGWTPRGASVVPHLCCSQSLPMVLRRAVLLQIPASKCISILRKSCCWCFCW